MDNAQKLNNCSIVLLVSEIAVVLNHPVLLYV
jgi:hypothetical protein